MTIVLAFLNSQIVWGTATVNLPSAQSDGWPPPEKIFETQGVVVEAGMAALVDRQQQLHLFFTHAESGKSPKVIEHMSWSLETGWTSPNDIFITGEEVVAPISGVIDIHNIVHLIWYGIGGLKYSKAPASMAKLATSWSEPITIANSTYYGAAIAYDEKKDMLYVVYSDAANEGTLKIISSPAQGPQWSFPSHVLSILPGTVPSRLTMAVDNGGRIHVTWTTVQLPKGWPPIGVYYIHSLNDGGWSEPKQVDDEFHTELGVATVGETNVHLVWRSNVGRDGTYHQFSPDGGDTWLPFDRYPDGGGQSGLPSFGVDSLGRLHYVIGPGKYTFWDGQQLMPYFWVSKHLQDDGGEPERARLAITNGNRLHIFVEDQFKSIWHYMKILDAPFLEGESSRDSNSQKIQEEKKTHYQSEQKDAKRNKEEDVKHRFPINTERTRIKSTSVLLMISIVPVLLWLIMVIFLQVRR